MWGKAKDWGFINRKTGKPEKVITILTKPKMIDTSYLKA